MPRGFYDPRRVGNALSSISVSILLPCNIWPARIICMMSSSVFDESSLTFLPSSRRQP